MPPIEDIAGLKSIHWRDWPDDIVKEATPPLSSWDIKAFFEAYGSIDVTYPSQNL